MGDTVGWVGDQLYDLLGFSERATAEFLVGLARKSSSAQNLITKFRDTSAFEDIGPKVLAFANDLYNRVSWYEMANGYTFIVFNRPWTRRTVNSVLLYMS